MRALTLCLLLLCASACSVLLDREVKHCREGERDPQRGRDFVCATGFWKQRPDAGAERDAATGTVTSESTSAPDAGIDAGRDAGRRETPDAAPPPEQREQAGAAAESGGAGAPASSPSAGSNAARADCRGAQDPPVFRVDGKQILDAAGCPFVPYGYNAALFYIDQPEAHLASLQHIASTSANAVRIVATTSAEPAGWWNANPTTQRQLVTEALRVGLVPILDMHDMGACDDYEGEPENIWPSIRSYWLTDAMVELAKSQPAMWLNLASRMPFADTQTFFEQYRDLVTALRDKGVDNLFVIDAGAKCGQDETTIVERGGDLLSADPRHNIVFAVHPFAAFGDDAAVERKLEALAATGLPVMIGAFAWDTPVAKNPGDQIAYATDTLLRTTQRLGMGWMFWSWYENEHAEQRAVDLLENTTLNAIGMQLEERMQGARRAALKP